MSKQWSNKPVDLRAASLISDRKGFGWSARKYECMSCGKRLTERQLDEAGGLCPEDSVVMRPLSHHERRHPLAKRARVASSQYK